MTPDGAHGEGSDGGGHADREGEVADSSAAETGAGSRATEADTRPGRRRLERLAGSTRSVEGSAYQGAMEATFAIVVAALLGYWADEHFGTSPGWLIVGVVVGFAAFVLRLVRMARLVEREGTPEEDDDHAN